MNKRRKNTSNVWNAVYQSIHASVNCTFGSDLIVLTTFVWITEARIRINLVIPDFSSSTTSRSKCPILLPKFVKIDSTSKPLNNCQHDMADSACWTWKDRNCNHDNLHTDCMTYCAACTNFTGLDSSWLLVSHVPVLCPLRPSSARSMEPSLSWAWRCCSREVRVCLSMELFMSSGPGRGPDIGGRSREEAFLSAGGTMLLPLRAPWIRLCPWQGGGSGGGGRSASSETHSE